MIPTRPLDAIPIVLVYVLYIVTAALAIELGFQIGRWLKRRNSEVNEGGLGALVGATLALLAFLLAFVTGLATNRYGERRELVIAEANAIGTAYLRAGYLPEPERSESRALYAEYVDQRLAALEPGGLQAAIERSEAIHGELWSRAEYLAIAEPGSPLLAIYVEALNEVIDLHTERIIAAGARLPAAVSQAVYIVALLAMVLVGVQNGVLGNRNLLATTIMVLIFAGVLQLITDLDRPQEGIITVSQQALIDLQRQLSR